MADLFHYIEHEFVVPAKTDAVDVENQSDFQETLRLAALGDNGYVTVREKANDFITSTFKSPADDPVPGTAKYAEFRSEVGKLTPVTAATVGQLVQRVFGQAASQLVQSGQFFSDKQLLQNAIVAIKIVTGFGRADAATLVRSIQIIALIENVAAGVPATLTSAVVDQLLSRPIRISPGLLIAPGEPVATLAPPNPHGSVRAHLITLRNRRDQLRSTYQSLMALHPTQLETAPLEAEAEAEAGARRLERRTDPPTDTESGMRSTAANASAAVLRIASAAREALPADQLRVLDGLPIDAVRASFAQVVDVVRRQWIDANRELLPAEVPGPAKVHRVGSHVFAVTDMPVMETLPGPAPASGAGLVPDPGPAPPPDFSHAITRPVGVGNLQVVRQELVGYKAGDISHIENVLEGEVLKRSTRREEVNELTITDETDTTQSQERDHQSTTRNELATETQKESGHQTTTSSDSTTSTDYGKLVENSKTNYAQSVTSKAVDTLTSMVKQQRVQREKKSYVEHAVHELDNKLGTKKVRGIYQWVDKKYNVRALNYGKRLLYDVVVPEPASFLVQSLKDTVQPESFQLTKPNDPGLAPYDLSAANYEYYASLYGVTGSVKPPPQEFTHTVAHLDAVTVEKEINAFNGKFFGLYYGYFTIPVPDNYKAIGGYIQRCDPCWVAEKERPPAADIPWDLEFFIGEGTYCRFGASPHPPDFLNNITTLNISFPMAGETGDIPVTVHSATYILQFNYAVGINCQRTDLAYEQWQLTTHATIVSGYQRQLAAYEDKLGRYTAAVRNQMAMAGNYAHDPTIERDELKKAFIYLLLGEHFSAYLPTPTPAPVPSLGLPPDPAEVKRWGAMVAFFERAFEWENIMYTFYPYFWGRPERWPEMILTQDANPQFEAFLKAGAARVVIPVRPGFEAALAHYHETGDVWMGKEIPDMFSDNYVSIIAEIKAANHALADEVCVDQWEVTLPTTLVMLKDDEALPSWKPTDCNPPGKP